MARLFYNGLDLHTYLFYVVFCGQSLQAQKSDNQQMKVKLRRLEEDGAKREKQIGELLDPTKVGSQNCF